ncbi:unnamed protein product [Effrenium voratum]|uniref:Uncharacterized protein n=1 Tax=Effrenium voratum TaxID=2562239 RepID=A0AA36MNV8_9DINO|nr:unnamed protein product [Effrenium voratum]
MALGPGDRPSQRTRLGRRRRSQEAHGSLAKQAAALLANRKQAEVAPQEKRRRSSPPVRWQGVHEKPRKEAWPKAQRWKAQAKAKVHEKARVAKDKGPNLADDVLLRSESLDMDLLPCEEVCLGGDEDGKEKDRDEDTDTVPLGFTLHVSRLPPDATESSLRKMCQYFGVQVVRVRRPSPQEAEVLLGPLSEPERTRRTHLLCCFLEERAKCQVTVQGGLLL